jgi:hypothetical protein
MEIVSLSSVEEVQVDGCAGVPADCKIQQSYRHSADRQKFEEWLLNVVR